MNSPTSRLAAAFKKRANQTALIPYITSGDPSAHITPALMHALVTAGADILELGVPFSDPMADGPTIQHASERAIARGVGLTQVLGMVAQFRRDDATTPVVLMGYANPIERMGQTAFVDAAKKAGVDGILVVDYPPEEIVDFSQQLDAAGIAPIFLLAPTSTEERIKMVARVARGYVYYVSLKGVTGAANIDLESVTQKLAEIRRHVSIPVGVGFGIRDADSASRIGSVADAVVIGSKLIQVMQAAVEQSQKRQLAPQACNAAAIDAAQRWLSTIRTALDATEKSPVAHVLASEKE